VPSGSAPGKVILYGEHAVVFGEPAAAVAVDLRAEVYARPHPEWRADGATLDDPKYAYVKAAVERGWRGPPQWLEIRSRLPLGAGMGSSAAVTVATLTALQGMSGTFSRERVALEAFEVELAVQGRASPIDTSAATAGRGVLVLRQREEGFLWEVRRGETAWQVHAVDLPKFQLVVGTTGIAAPTGPIVAGVRERVEKDPRARAAVERIGQITLEGVAALRRSDLVTAGVLMDQNHALLNELRVGGPMLESLVKAARKHAYGAKLTGAGVGGSMIALTDVPEEAVTAIEEAGGRAFTVSVDREGAKVGP